MQQNPPVVTTWVTRREAAAYTKLTVATLSRAVSAGKLPAYRINGRKHVRFRIADLDAYLSASPVEVTP